MARGLLLACVIALGAVSGMSGNAGADSAAKARAVEDALRAWYAAIHSYDLPAVADALTASFMILEDTVLLDKQALLDRLRRGQASGSQTAELSEFKTRVQGSIAWTTLRNREVWTPNSGPPVKLEFLETVVLQKVGGRWRIDRYHASRVRNPE